MLTAATVSPVSGFKSRLKYCIQKLPFLWSIYWRTKHELLRIAMLSFFCYDIFQTYKAMFWKPSNKEFRSLGAELLFQYHKLEKGLVMPGKRRLFGLIPAKKTMDLISRWRQAGYATDDPIFIGAVETMRSYYRHLVDHELDSKAEIVPLVKVFLASCSEEDISLQTPYELPRAEVLSSSPADAFRCLAEARRSVRDFLPNVVPQDILEEAIRLAQLSPSACNRQPCRVFLVNTNEHKEALLALQNGNAGFGHLAPHVAMITADEECFFDASERHEPYIDGGLFSMSLVLALRANNVSSCCLNWCVSPNKDRAAHRLFNIPSSQRIIMLIAIGYAPEGCAVPRSPRRDISDVLTLL